MATKEHPHNYWNKERCAEELSKYTRKLEAKHGSPGAYNSAYQHGWLETIAPHLISKTYWSREKCFKRVKEKGHKNEKNSEFCSPCGENIKGLNRNHLKKVEQFKVRVEALERLMLM